MHSPVKQADLSLFRPVQFTGSDRHFQGNTSDRIGYFARWYASMTCQAQKTRAYTVRAALYGKNDPAAL